MKKRILSLLLAVIMLVSAIPFAVSANAAALSDATVLSRINTLYSLIGNTYFTVDHSTGCGKKVLGTAVPIAIMQM